MFHNTVPIEGDDLNKKRQDVKSQEGRILRYLQHYANTGFTPFQLCRDIFQNEVPVTSVRRALSDLTRAGKITKLEDVQAEKYGMPNHKWAYMDDPMDEEDLFDALQEKEL